MIRLHTIGDSHADTGTWSAINIPGLEIVTHSLSPMTCASFGFGTVDINNFNISQDDWVVYCFGEIDCRDNIGKHDNYQEIIDKIVENYLYRVGTYKIAKVFIFSVPPAVIQATAAGDPWPCTGSDEQRREYVRYMNERLREGCESCGYDFFDVHDKYADENGFFNLKYRDNCVHIADPVFLKEYLSDKVKY